MIKLGCFIDSIANAPSRVLTVCVDENDRDPLDEGVPWGERVGLCEPGSGVYVSDCDLRAEPDGDTERAAVPLWLGVDGGVPVSDGVDAPVVGGVSLGDALLLAVKLAEAPVLTDVL